MSNAIQRMGFDVKWATSLAAGLEIICLGDIDVVLLDVRLPDGDGLSVLPGIQKVTPKPEVIIMTGFSDPEGAELAIKSGAWDYLQKPVGTKALKLALTRALEYQSEKRQRSQVPISLDRRGIIGDSPTLRSCLDLVAQAAQRDINVLITGETGTGKELFAQAIHKNSQRSNRSFTVVDCAALPGTLVESTLFGHEKGAYTGADHASIGLIMQADGGTLFLDEIGELPLDIQKRFLRVLQERTFRPVGSKREQKSDFRLIAATNQDLDGMVARGAFRGDLLFRLRSVTIDLPPLRERPEDIKPLALNHLAKLCDKYHSEMKGFSADFFKMLRAYEWPGNVRELNQSLEKALVSAGNNPTLFAQDLPAEIRAKVARKSVGSSDDLLRHAKNVYGVVGFPSPLPKLEDVRKSATDEVISKYLEALLKHTAGNLTKARRIAGLSRSRLYTLLKYYQISYEPEDPESA